jgi:hypothetical protein
MRISPAPRFQGVQLSLDKPQIIGKDEHLVALQLKAPPLLRFMAPSFTTLYYLFTNKGTPNADQFHERFPKETGEITKVKMIFSREASRLVPKEATFTPEQKNYLAFLAEGAELADLYFSAIAAKELFEKPGMTLEQKGLLLALSPYLHESIKMFSVILFSSADTSNFVEQLTEKMNNQILLFSGLLLSNKEQSFDVDSLKQEPLLTPVRDFFKGFITTMATYIKQAEKIYTGAQNTSVN